MLGAMKLKTAYQVACEPSETSYLGAVDRNLDAVGAMLVTQMKTVG